MPGDITDFYDDGSIKWTGRRSLNADNFPLPDPITNNELITELVGTDIKTDVQGQSIKIVKMGEKKCHMAISEVSSWNVNGNVIIINSSDELPLTLIFIKPSEALIGDDRLAQICNGAMLT